SSPTRRSSDLARGECSHHRVSEEPVGDRRALVGRTTIVVDDGLIRRAMRVSGAKTKREAVDRALREMVARGSVYRALRKLKGQMPWDGDVEAWRRQRGSSS